MNLECIEKIRKSIWPIEKEISIDGIYVSNNSNIKYILEKNIEGYVYIEKEKIYIITDGRYIEELNIISGATLINMSTKEGKESLINLLQDKIIAIESKDLTLYKLNNLKEKYLIKQFIETIDIVENIRVKKNKEEINNIEKACEITDKAFKYILTYIKPGISEKQIKNELEFFIRTNGAEDIAFNTIIASGENSSKPHAISSDRLIQLQDIVLLDFGCKYNGYCSDMTRTIFVGSITKEQERIYNIVKNAQQLVIDNAKENCSVRDLDNMVRSEFSKYNLEDKFIHSTGHGVGLDIHEIPSVSNKNEYVLKENMVITDEPGLYFENNFGIRIEDSILIQKDKCVTLTKSSKEVVILK